MLLVEAQEEGRFRQKASQPEAVQVTVPREEQYLPPFSAGRPVHAFEMRCGLLCMVPWVLVPRRVLSYLSRWEALQSVSLCIVQS